MEPTRALRLVAIVAALLTLAGGWPAPEAAAQPARLVAAQPPTDAAPPGGTDPGTRSAERSAAAARARAAAAAQQARAAAAEARRVAQLAAARQRVRATWESRGRPARLVIVRDVSLDIVTQGRLTRRTPRRAGPLNLTTLSRYLPRSWLSIDGGTATLSTAVVLTPRVVLDVGGDVTTVKLTGGATLPQAASIYTGSGRILLHGVTVTSADPAIRAAARRQPRPAVRRGDVRRPARRHRRDGHRPRHVGRRAQAPPRRPVQRRQQRLRGPLHLPRNSVGLQLERIAGRPPRGRHRHRVAGPRPGASRDRGTVLSGIRAERNGGNGIRLDRTTTEQPDHRDQHGRQRPVRYRRDPAAGHPDRGHAHHRRHRGRAGAEPVPRT